MYGVVTVQFMAFQYIHYTLNTLVPSELIDFDALDTLTSRTSLYHSRQ